MGYKSNDEFLYELSDFCGLCLKAEQPYSPAWREIKKKLEDTSGQLPVTALLKAFELGECGEFCVMLTLGCELDGAVRNRLRELCGLTLPSFDAAFSIWSRENPLSPGEAMRIAGHESALRKFLLAPCDGEDAPVLFAPVRLRTWITGYLCGAGLNPGGPFSLRTSCDGLRLHGERIFALCGFGGRVLAGKASDFAYIAGEPGAGKRTLAAMAAAELGLPLLNLELDELDGDRAALRDMGREMFAAAAISGAAVCLCGYGPGREGWPDMLLEPFSKTDALIFVTADGDHAPPRVSGRGAYAVRLRMLSPGDMRLASEAWGCAPLFERFPDYLRLTASELRQAWLSAGVLAHLRGGVPAREDFLAGVKGLKSSISDAHTLERDVAFDDVVVSDSTREKLELFCQMIDKSGQLRDEWGFSSLQAYGRGITGLFCGASGTGKSMAASALANRMGLELIRIDLSRVLDKYIGETEKRLSRLFEQAKNRNCILFFDEADALFSKRTEISSSHDRYANVETSFLLQCLEDYDGVSILATNLLKNFDEAFLRRVTVIVKFTMPDDKLRLGMWRGFFPPQTPLAPDVDLKLLADELELAPAVIKSAAFTAAALAAGDGECVTMRHILAALENELGKLGRESDLMAFA